MSNETKEMQSLVPGMSQTASQEQDDGWVKTKDRLPGEDDLKQSPRHMFLVTSGGVVCEASYEPQIQRFFRHFEVLPNVTHWKHLPKPGIDLPMNTAIEYLYRDAANNKTHFREVVSGTISDEQIAKIMECLIDGENFDAEMVGLEFWRPFTFDTELDHDFCEIGSDSFSHTNAPSTSTMNVEGLVNAFVTAASQNWSKGGV